MACHGFCPLQLHSQSYFGRGFRPINSSSWHSKAIGKCLGTEAADALWQGGEGKDLDELGNPKLVGGETHVYTVNTLLLHNVYYVKYKIYSHNNYYNIIYVEWPHHTMICSVECCHYVVATHIYRHKAKKQIVMETYGCGPDNRVPQSGCLLEKVTKVWRSHGLSSSISPTDAIAMSLSSKLTGGCELLCGARGWAIVVSEHAQCVNVKTFIVLAII